jgi:hypothetical protein
VLLEVAAAVADEALVHGDGVGKDATVVDERLAGHRRGLVTRVKVMILKIFFAKKLEKKWHFWLKKLQHHNIF